VKSVSRGKTMLRLAFEQRRFYNPHHHPEMHEHFNRPTAGPGMAKITAGCTMIRLCYVSSTSDPKASVTHLKRRFIEECGMKKVVVASLLAVAGMVCVSGIAEAQTPVNLGSNQQAGSTGVQMSPAEYNAYNSAITQTDPKAKAAALEAYLAAYPQSAVKGPTLEQLMLAYSGFDPAKTLDAADRLLQVDPNNLRGLTFETYFRLSGADSITDATAKQAALD
jgi:hypothetical protein